MKDSRMLSGGAVPSGSRSLATNLHQVGKRAHEEKHSRIGVSKLSSSSSRSVAQLMNRLSWYVERPKVLSVAPQIKWKCPPSFSPDRRWLVAAGEESQEATYQRHRETTVEKVVYPSHAAIPLSPFPATALEAEHHDDSLIPAIPLIPVEELVEDVQVTDAEINAKIAQAAAAIVVAALEMEDSIDMQLLINILSDPQMVKKLMNGVHPWIEGEGETSNPARSEPGGMQQHVESPIPSMSMPAAIMSVPGAITLEQPVKPSTSKTDVESIKRLIHDYGARSANMISPPMTPINLFTSSLVPHIAEAARVRPPVTPVIASASRLSNVEKLYTGPCPSMLPPTHVPPHFPISYIPPPHYCPPTHIMDSNHILSVIEPHGMKHETEKQNLPMFGQYGHFIQGLGSAHNNPTCVYFITSRGCRNGSNCRFKHA